VEYRAGASCLNRIKPWRMMPRSLALKGRCFEAGDEVVAAVEKTTVYWNARRHPFR
jgi:hypothetical protein